ncbi:DUF1570 domain-containing protein [Bythopirellula goksoeyrii]|uniref:DUF1570 domain-containing protein n=1 Tax=Bythopirellula goksoeyrii TaxID=1400387 RepID=A0A5B9Q8B5_9BACT|nr:DUF1570 domain-containing protein [Bythopirellula goksoeyrii]QEG33899.1 hypothetical protein Pr1d_11690 [Bythopirellula goksoeyrii]
MQDKGLSAIYTLLAVCLALPQLPATAVETVLLDQKGEPQQLIGEVVLEDSAGSLLLETDEGAFHTIMANMIRSRESDARPLERLDKDGMAERLLAEMGPGFQVYQSKHYVVVYNTTIKYATWCSSLLERLQRGFLAYWKKQGCEVEQPEHPLAVVIFGNKASYIQYAKKELGPAAGSAIGYYSLKTNRIAMYDLTGMQALRREDTRRGSSHDITAMLSEPEAAPLVATIVHEATHQIAFNCGMQTRFGANPVWLGEGLAMFHETPDLGSNRSWSGIGKVNYDRWDRYRNNANNDRVAPLRALIVSDERFRNPRMAVDAYAEAWAWTYFLITWHTDEYVAYMKHLAAKPVLSVDDKRTRLADFTKHFGRDFDALEDEFYRRMSRID